MPVTSSVSSLLSGAYIGMIQSALGDSGASMTMREGDLGSLRITGTPTGEGFKIKARRQAQQAARADTVSLSPAARAMMDNATIALKVIQASTPGADSSASNKTPAVPAAQATSSAARPAAADTTPYSDSELAASNPAGLVHDTVAAAMDALHRISTTDGFRTEMTSNPAAFQSFLKDYA